MKRLQQFAKPQAKMNLRQGLLVSHWRFCYHRENVIMFSGLLSLTIWMMTSMMEIWERMMMSCLRFFLNSLSHKKKERKRLVVLKSMRHRMRSFHKAYYRNKKKVLLSLFRNRCQFRLIGVLRKKPKLQNRSMNQ